jgi:PAS domain S-box-containing protein
MTPEGIVGKNANAPVPEPASSKRKRVIAEVMETRQPAHFEDRRRNTQFRNIVYAFNDPQTGELLDAAVVSEDITDRRKAEEALALQARIAGIFVTVPDDEMFNEVLKVILEVTHSRFGVFGYLDEGGAVVVPTMIRQTWEKCQASDKTIRFPRGKWGEDSWCRSLREKRTIHSNEPSTRILAGHVAVQRHIAAPILLQGEVIGIFEVANKETDYTEADIRTLEAVARHVSPLLNARLHREWTQEALRERTKELICLYVVSRDIQEDLPIDELCRRAVEHLIAAMQFPEITVPVIELNGKRFTSENYTAGLAPLFDAEIGMEGEASGHLRVYCAAERPFLSPEEQRLVKGVAQILGTWFSHKGAEEELKKAEQDYRMLAENSPDLIARFDTRVRYLYVNPAAARAGELSASEYVGLTIAESGVPEPVATTWDQRLGQVLRTGETLEVEDASPTPEGIRYFHTRLIPERTADGSVCSVLSVARDITKRRRAEETLRESEERFRQLTDTMPDTVLVGQDGRNVYANPAAARLLRAAGPEELVGLDVFAIIEPSQHEWARQQMQRTLGGENPPPFEDRFVRLDGSLVPVEVAASVLTWQGRPALQVVVRDITERKQAEKRTQMFSQEIIAAREEERKQVSFVLHGDVGSLAVGISAHLDAIEEDLRSGKPAEVPKWMKRTRKLFEGSLARLKGLAVQLRPPELDVLGLGAALRQHFSQVTEQRSARIRFREALGRRRVSGDTATILFRIAQEALTNAITHGGSKRVDVDLSASRKEVALIVRDNGKGFDPSEEGERVTSQMGLRVMREMAAAAGGAFTVDSGRGKGTTVRVSLPFKTAALGPGNVTVREETVARGKTTRSASKPTWSATPSRQALPNSSGPSLGPLPR